MKTYNLLLLQIPVAESRLWMIRLKIKDVAQQKGISQRQMILHSGLDTRIVKKCMHNPHANITLETLDKFALFLGVPAQDLIESVPDVE